MFDIGWPEMLVIAIVLIVVVGPKDLPKMLRAFGKTTAKLRTMAGDFRKQFDEALKEAELDDVKSLAEQARKLDPRNEIRKHLSPFEQAGEQVKAGLDKAMKPQAAAMGDPAPDEPKPTTPPKPGTAAMPVEASAATVASEPTGEVPAAKAPVRSKPTAKAAGPARAGKGAATPAKTAARARKGGKGQ